MVLNTIWERMDPGVADGDGIDRLVVPVRNKTKHRPRALGEITDNRDEKRRSYQRDLWGKRNKIWGDEV